MLATCSQGQSVLIFARVCREVRYIFKETLQGKYAQYTEFSYLLVPRKHQLVKGFVISKPTHHKELRFAIGCRA
jgi:Zn/Cd-binding protein ZinT